MNFYSVLSNLILLIHFAFVAFIVGGLVMIWIGRWRHWHFVSNFYFRVTHLLAMMIVVLESVLGLVCPLTAWENELRVRAGQDLSYQESFIQHWIGRVLFYDFQERVFTLIYVAVFLLMFLTLWWVPPRKRGESHSGS